MCNLWRLPHIDKCWVGNLKNFIWLKLSPQFREFHFNPIASCQILQTTNLHIGKQFRSWSANSHAMRLRLEHRNSVFMSGTLDAPWRCASTPFLALLYSMFIIKSFTFKMSKNRYFESVFWIYLNLGVSFSHCRTGKITLTYCSHSQHSQLVKVVFESKTKLSNIVQFIDHILTHLKSPRSYFGCHLKRLVWYFSW